MSILSVDQISPIGSGTTITLTSTETKTGNIITVGTGASVFSPAGNTLAFGTNNTERLRITNAGKIGIGTNNPTQLIEVQDRSTGTLCGLNVGTQYGNAHFGGYNNYPAIMNSGNQPLIYCDTNNDRTVLFGDTVGFGTTCVLRVNGAERLRITSDGKIGQGSASPSYEFHSYKSSGTVRARLQTAGSSSSDWSDSVVQAGSNYIQQFIYGTGYGYMNGSASVSMSYGNIANAPVYFSTNNTSRALFDTSGNLQILDGNLKINTAGHGIDFSASGNAGGMTSELLDDYEEGSWTPSIISQSGSITSYTTQIGSYTKIGRTVIAEYDIRISDKGNISGSYILISLPMNHVGSRAGSGTVYYFQNLNSNVSSLSIELGGATPTRGWLLGVTGTQNTQNSYLGASYLTNTTQLSGQLIYRAS